MSVIIFSTAFLMGASVASGLDFAIRDIGWLVVVLIAHDAYFYWWHRMLHHRRLWRFHRSHHVRIPLHAAHSLKVGPVEAFIEAIFIPACVVFWTPNLWAYVVFTLIMFVSNWWGHAGRIFGIAPKWRFKWLNRPEDHEIHHDLPGHNFSAYFPFWDYVAGTRWHPEIEKYEIDSKLSAGESEQGRNGAA